MCTFAKMCKYFTIHLCVCVCVCVCVCIVGSCVYVCVCVFVVFVNMQQCLYLCMYARHGAHNTLLFVLCKDSISCLPQYSGIHLHLRIFVFVILSLYSHYIPKGVRNISGTSYIISGTSYSYTSSVRTHKHIV